MCWLEPALRTTLWWGILIESLNFCSPLITSTDPPRHLSLCRSMWRKRLVFVISGLLSIQDTSLLAIRLTTENDQSLSHQRLREGRILWYLCWMRCNKWPKDKRLKFPGSTRYSWGLLWIVTPFLDYTFLWYMVE